MTSPTKLPATEEQCQAQTIKSNNDTASTDCATHSDKDEPSTPTDQVCWLDMAPEMQKLEAGERKSEKETLVKSSSWLAPECKNSPYA